MVYRPAVNRIKHTVGVFEIKNHHDKFSLSVMIAYRLRQRSAMSELKLSLMTAAGQQLGAEVTFTRTLDTFLECFLRRQDGERVEMDFAQDTPYRLAPVEQNADYQIQVVFSCN